MNASAIGCSRMMRLAARQTYPALPKRALTAVCTALSRSASASAMKASAPPGSSRLFFSALAAVDATAAPARTLPVGVMAGRGDQR